MAIETFLTGVNNADFLGVPPTASQEEIGKASRKKSRQLHPDKIRQSYVAARATATRKPKLGKAKNSKNPGVTVNKAPKESEILREVDVARKRYERLSVVVEILKGEGRERYDHFLAHGFPTWRGTGYYYARFRPGLGSVLVGLFVMGGGAAHYGAMYLSWKRQRDFVERYIRHARKSAWGDESRIGGIPGIDGHVLGTSSSPTSPPSAAGAAASSLAQENGAAVLNRRQKRAQDKEAKKEEKKGKRLGTSAGNNSGTSTPIETEPTPPPPPPPSGPQGARKRVQAENGKVLIVDSFGNVFLEEDDEDGNRAEFLLDPNEIPAPTIHDTVLYRLPLWAYAQVRARVTGERVTMGGAGKGRKLGANGNGSGSGEELDGDGDGDGDGILVERGEGEEVAAMATANGNGSSAAARRKGKRRPA